MNHHTEIYIKNTLVPIIETWLVEGNKAQNGRIINDDDLSTACTEITEAVIKEIGESYQKRLFLYFDNLDKLIQYILNRVYNTIFDFAVEENQKYIKSRKTKKIILETAKS